MNENPSFDNSFSNPTIVLLENWNRLMKNEPLLSDVKSITEYNKTETPVLDKDGSLGIEIDFVKAFGDKMPERLQGFKTSQIIPIPAVEGEPVPPAHHYRGAGHHWIQKIDSDGHHGDCVCLQWNPSAKRWSHSGYVGSGIYVETKGWKYVAYCPMPDFN